MKKTIIALSIAAISSAVFAADTTSQNSKPVFEFDPVHKDQFSVSGAFGLGGYYDTKSKAIYDDWATGLTLAVNYRNNRLVGYVEADLELNYTTDEDAPFPSETDLNTDIDKAWFGIDTGYGVASFGWENDTALDAVDGAGDFTHEFGTSVDDASDAFNVVKFQGSTSGIAYGLSYFETDETHSDADKGVNGYLGFEHEVFNVYAGYEARDDADYDLATITGNATFGQFQLGMNAWQENGQSDVESNTTDFIETGYYVSSAYALNEQLTLAMGYAYAKEEQDGQSDIEASYVNIAAKYNPTDVISMGMDIRQDIDVEAGNDEETYVFANAYYFF
ncbi:porin [Vibrio maerlii]|uniref:porin n=1 Tax=Vibrio maerlii TaxID=2231648 RepID=UPI000E3D42E6|nr:porin [Vibrio maerlii]